MKKILLSSAALSALLFTAASAQAAGFYIQEQSVSGLGASFAGQAAMPRDASILFYNPAGMAELDQGQINLGLHMIAPHAALEDTGTTIAGFSLAQLGREHDDGGNPGSLSPIPNAYLAVPVTDDHSLWAGIGISAPFGLGVEYNDEFFGRYLSTKVDLRTMDIQPGLAWKPNKYISLGGSVVFEYARANFQQKLANEDLVRLAGDAITMGYSAGVMLHPLEGTRIGISYRSEINHKAEGDQTTELGTLGSDTGANAKIKLPDTATLALAQDIGPRWTLLGQVSRMGWDNFDSLQVIPENAGSIGPTLLFDYQDSWAYSAGAEYKASDTLTLRGGIQFDQTPTTDEGRSAFNPDGDRIWYSGGASWKVSEDLSFDAGLSYIDIDGEPINQTRSGGVAVKADVNDAYVVIGSVGLTYKF
jgi:long-chain fatty acid transport protein